MLKKSVVKNIFATLALLTVSGTLILCANKCVRWDGFIPRDVYFSGGKTSDSAPIGWFILITVGIAFLLWIISSVIRAIERRNDEKCGWEDNAGEAKPPEDDSKKK